MDYKKVIGIYRDKFSSATCVERFSLIYDLFVDLKAEGLTMANLNEALIKAIEEITIDNQLDKVDQAMLASQLQQQLRTLTYVLDKGEVKQAPAEEEQDDEYKLSDEEKRTNEKLSKMKPEDFPKKEIDWEFYQFIGGDVTKNPDEGESHE